MKIPFIEVVIFCGLFSTVNSTLAQTWLPVTNAPVTSWNAIASSADGTKLVAVTYNGLIYNSADSGATWTTNDMSDRLTWVSVASSADGVKLVASGNHIYTST